MTSEELADLELTPRDLQGLSSPDALTAFFARLGYDTNTRLPMTAEALQLTAEGTRRPILRIERLADQDGLFQVYLFEVKSITRTHTRALARHFRNLGVPYFLLILAAPDYERVDFVLLEPYLPDGGQAKGIATPQARLRPRVLSVERRKPANLDLRVLRRFTWTEPDPFAQYDKLLAAYTLAEWSEEEFNNRALFADYYLLNRLPERDAWKEDPKPVYRQLRDLYRGAPARLAGKGEAALRRELLEPALDVLGFAFREGKPAGSDAQEPDYELLSPEGGDRPLAFCLAYPWDRFLDGKDAKRDTESPEENPGALVVSLLEQRRAPWAVVTNGRLWRLYAAAAHAKATSYYEIDLEEVLSQAGPHALDPTTAFRYFWLLFRREAFESRAELEEGQEVERSFLDNLLRGSQEYARELGERLKERVFAEVFSHLAEGFLRSHRDARGRSAEISQEELDRIFQGTLTLLYRLLFLLYAEARDLLPVREVREYALASLKKIKEEIAEAGGDIEDEVPDKLAKRYGHASFDLWQRLFRIFRAVDQGDPALNLPSYNGGLFLTEPSESNPSLEAEAAHFLAAHAVPDFHLAMALDRLARDLDPKSHSLVPVDYKSLGVRQLGSIYEGLLEFRLRIAAEKLAVVKEKSREVYRAFSELEEKQRERAERRGRITRKGDLYLENDRHERKATGSYYTPDYVVQYIVEEAVGPVLTEKLEALRPRLREADKWRREKVKLARQKGDPKTKYESGEVVIRHFQGLIDAVFDVKVLDPAMGSGHFLVEAVDFLTDKLLHFLNAFPWNPVRVYLDDTRREILESAEAQEVTLAPSRLTDVHLLKRHVLKRCVYGVDLNPMAVELAKVSLWLHCFTLGAPLSFLDHHLRCGNSLVGVTVDEVQKALGEADARQALLFGSRFAGLRLATDLMRQVGELSDVTMSQVAESRSQYREASEALAPFKRILDVYTSQWFGNGVENRQSGAKRQPREPVALTFLRTEEGEPFLNAADDAATEASLAALDPKLREIASRTLEAAQTVRFFHWDLEFPEVFYGPREGTERVIEYNPDAGFDAVVGNPPYVRVQELRQSNPALADYLKERYDSAEKSFDLYLPFFEVGLDLSCGPVFYIAPNKWFATDYGRGLRRLVASRQALAQVVDFKDFQVFEGVTNYTAIVGLDAEPQETFLYVDASAGKIEAGDSVSTRTLSEEGGTWSFGSMEEMRLLGQLLRPEHPRLGDLLDRAFQGIRTSDNKVYVLKQTGDPRNGYLPVRSDATGQVHEIEEALLKPLLSGDDIRAFSLTHRGQWLIFPYDLTGRVPRLLEEQELRQGYPGTWEYLSQVEKRLRARERGKLDKPTWWEFGRNQNLDQFEQPKVMVPGYHNEPAAAIDGEGRYYCVTAYCLTLRSDAPIDLRSLACVLNSAPVFWYLQKAAVSLRGGFVEFRPQYLSSIPLPPLAQLATPLAQLSSQLDAGNVTTETFRRELDELLRRLYGFDSATLGLDATPRLASAHRGQPT